MSPRDMVQVTIYDAPAAGAAGCACGCGGHGGHDHDHGLPEGRDPVARVSMELQARALALTLEAAFPGMVQVEYLNVLQDPRGRGLPQTALLCSLAYPTPLVYINGRGRFAGALPVDRIREEIAKILEMD
ncbi:MAG: hypothetical protein ACLQED_02215 [Desulfobaccales bacterium]